MEMTMFELTGLGGLLLFALDIWALVSIINSPASTGTKVIWSLVVIFLPLIGFIAWLFAGPRSASA